MTKRIVAAIMILGVAGLAAVSVPFLQEQSAQRIKEGIARTGTLTVEAVDVSLLARRVTLHDVRPKDTKSFAIGRVEISGLALPLSDLLSGQALYSGYRPGDPIRASRVELDEIRLSSGSNQATIKSLAIDDFDLDRYDAKVDTSPEDGVTSPHIPLSARILAALSSKKLLVTNATYPLTLKGEIGIGSILIERLDHGRVGSVVADNFTVVRPGGTITVAETKLTDLDFHRPLKNLSSSAWLEGDTVGRVDMGSMKLAGFGGEFLVRQGISLDSISFVSTDQPEGANRSQLRVDGFRLVLPTDPSGMGPGHELMQATGLKEIRIDLDCNMTGNRGKATLSVERCALLGPAFGEVDLTARFVEVDAIFWNAFDDDDVDALVDSRIALDGAQLKIADRGIIELASKALPIPRPAAAQEIRRFQPPGVLISQDLTNLLDTVARFVEAGGTLAIDAKPPSPIALNTAGSLFRRGSDLVGVLGLSASQSSRSADE